MIEGPHKADESDAILGCALRRGATADGQRKNRHKCRLGAQGAHATARVKLLSTADGGFL